MYIIPYIDIHTHRSENEENVITVTNIFPGQAIPAFSGKNFYSVGLHPWKISSEQVDNERMLMMEDALELDHVLFVGECGLDKLADTPFDEQIRAFKAQAFMAEEYRKPLIIHCVKAWNEVLEISKNLGPTVPWIFHAYNGSVDLTRQLLDKNFLFSFGKILFNENSKGAASLKLLSPEKMFLESDEFNRPIEEIYMRAAEIKGVPLEAIKQVVWENFNRIENISISK